MARSLLFLLYFSFFTTHLFAQTGQRSPQGDLLKTLQEQGPGDQVTLEMDSLLVSNYNKLIASSMNSSGVPGYRIRIYSESGIEAKKEQQKVRARFLSLYPGLDAYNRYEEPFFKIYVGDCRTKSEALKLYDMIKKDFPNPIIKEDYTNPKSVD